MNEKLGVREVEAYSRLGQLLKKLKEATEEGKLTWSCRDINGRGYYLDVDDDWYVNDDLIYYKGLREICPSDFSHLIEENILKHVQALSSLSDSLEDRLNYFKLGLDDTSKEKSK